MTQHELMGLTFFPRQWQAVASPPGPVLLACLRLRQDWRRLTGRIAYLVQNLDVDPLILCRHVYQQGRPGSRRVARRGLGPMTEQRIFGTLHKLCLDLLRPYLLLGLPMGFGIADETYQTFVLGRLGVHSNKHRPLLRLFGQRRLDDQSLARTTRPCSGSTNANCNRTT